MRRTSSSSCRNRIGRRTMPWRAGERRARRRQPGRQLRGPEAERQEVLRLREAVTLDKAAVIGWVVGHPHHRRQIVGVEEQPAFVVDGEARGAAQAPQPALPHPGGGPVEQGGGDLGIVDGFEESEEARGIVIDVQMAPVFDGGDPPDGLAVPLSQEEGGGGVAKERVFRRIEEVKDIAPQRRHPRAARVETPWEIDEAVKRAALRDRANLEHLSFVRAILAALCRGFYHCAAPAGPRPR